MLFTFKVFCKMITFHNQLIKKNFSVNDTFLWFTWFFKSSTLKMNWILCLKTQMKKILKSWKISHVKHYTAANILSNVQIKYLFKIYQLCKTRSICLTKRPSFKVFDLISYYYCSLFYGLYNYLHFRFICSICSSFFKFQFFFYFSL